MADAEKKTTTVQEIDVKGIKFTVDTDLMDDIDALEYIERIENKGQVAAVLPLLKLILGDEEFVKIKKEFTELDGKEHAAELKEAGEPADPKYKPRVRFNRLQDIYLAIIEKFDPKD